jgi:ubiquinone/menaquinone biosynthesis C-methylase UbiE
MKQWDAQNRNAVQRTYARLAGTYDDRWSFYIEQSLRETLKRLPMKPGQRLLDLGCGTGVLLERLAEKYPTLLLHGIDSTQEMLGVARQRLKGTVCLEQSWAEALPFKDASFDVVVSCNMFHYIRKPVQALQETRRVLKETGLFIVTDWCDDYMTCKIYDWLLRIFDPAHFKVYGRQACYNLLASSRFNLIEVERYKINWFWGMMTARARKNPAPTENNV